MNDTAEGEMTMLLFTIALGGFLGVLLAGAMIGMNDVKKDK